MKKFSNIINENKNDKQELIINEVTCRIRGTVHQNSGYIYISKSGADYFEKDDHDKVFSFLENNNLRPEAGVTTYNYKKDSISLYMGSETINDLFYLYIQSMITDYTNI